MRMRMRMRMIVFLSSLACTFLLLSSPISSDHLTTSCVATSACSSLDLASLRSIAAAFPPPLFAHWLHAAAHNNVCCGHWGPLTINCSSCNANQSSTIAPGNIGRVTALEIDLMSQYVEGIRPIGIPIAVCSLSALTSLRLVGNMRNLISGPIPGCIGKNLTRLVHLDLTSNSLTGSIPLSFSHLSSLQVLDLSYNQLSGTFPAFLSRVSHLTSLVLQSNSFSGPIPTFLNFTYLANLDLNSNDFSGPIPNTLNFTYLTSLDLSSNAFSGPLPTLSTPKLVSLNLRSNYISGSVSSLFWASNLTSLASMSLSNNQLKGVIPNFNPVHFASLSSIDFSSNQLSGSLPESLCGLISLTSLDLSSNAFSGQINALEICNFPKLESLDISENHFTGPFPDWVGSLSNLTDLSVGHNNFSGSLPNSWQNLTSLFYLELSGNSLIPASRKPGVPKLPCWLFALSKLEQLYLGSMQLRATDLAGICSSHCAGIDQGIPILAILDLSNNLFTSSILHCFSNITLFEPPPQPGELIGEGEPILNLSGNPLNLDLSDPNAVNLIPESLCSLDLSSCMLRGHLTKLFFDLVSPHYINLYLAHNLLEGQIPAELGNMANLDTVDLSNNFFTGFAPLTANRGLINFELKLSHNNLTGNLSFLLSRIIPNVSSCEDYLYNLDLSHNSLTGVIPPFLGPCLSPSTWRLKLNHNHLQGSLPNEPFPPSLHVLSLSHNQLSGQIPSSFRNLTQLMLLDLSYNKLEGNLQSTALFSIASSNQYAQLRVLLLGNNHFTGTIPSSLGDLAPALQVIDFSNNYLTGSIPMHTLQSLPAFKIMYFPPLNGGIKLDVVGGTLYEEIDINVKGNEETYTYVLQALTSLDLSSNRLSGPISTGMGELSGLVYLNLSRNNLSGPIPSDLGSLGGQLQSLDMSFNELVGPIPSSFQNLTNLAVFNVSYNKGLSGPIWLDNPQLENKDSYIGDPKLCGQPIFPNACPVNAVQDGNTPSSVHDEPHKSMNFVARWIDEWIEIPGLLLGTFVGFLGTLWALKAFGR